MNVKIILIKKNRRVNEDLRGTQVTGTKSSYYL